MLVPLATEHQIAPAPRESRSTAKNVLVTIPIVVRVAVMFTPGANRRMIVEGVPATLREEKSANVRPSSCPAATQITHGSTQYGLRVFRSGPASPAANHRYLPASAAPVPLLSRPRAYRVRWSCGRVRVERIFDDQRATTEQVGRLW